MSAYKEKLEEYLKKLEYYNRINTLMSWDMFTATPDCGYDDMADALTYFSTKEFELATSDEFFELLTEMRKEENYRELDEGMQFTVRIMLRDLEKQRRIPASFFSEFVAAKSASQKAWEEAKNKSDFSLFAPHLEKLIEMTKQQCAYTDPGKDVYSVLLDQYEEGVDPSDIDRVFEELKEGLLPLLNRILAAPQPSTSIYEKQWDTDAQKKVQKLLLEYIGFSFDKGTTGESEHPFTSGFSRDDVRVTNHFRENDPIGPMFSSIHEGGHAIFEQNSDPALKGTAAADCFYMGIHESQSRFFENILGRRKSFWVPIYAQIQELLPGLKEVDLDTFVREINHVKNSFIRTEADEVTYCLHIILRYEMEQAIFRDNVPVSSLPALWNRKMQDYLHITPSDDAHGILQDMHWSDASFGYFPSYLLGNIYDGMFLEKMEQDLGSLDTLLENGQIGIIRGWLNEKIHRYGALRLPKEVISTVCGKELSAKGLLSYFEKKYTDLYQL